MEEITEKQKKKNNFEKALSALQGDMRLPPIPPKKVELSAKDKEKKRKGKYPRKFDEE